MAESAITNELKMTSVQKIKKTLNNMHTTKQKLTNSGFRNTKSLDRRRTAWPFEILGLLKSLCSLLFCYYSILVFVKTTRFGYPHNYKSLYHKCVTFIQKLLLNCKIAAFIMEQICLPSIISNDTNSEKKLWCFMFWALIFTLSDKFCQKCAFIIASW